MMVAMLTAILMSLSFSPLGLEWDKELSDVPEIENYKYWYGDLHYGSATYLSTSDLAGMESEITLEFAAGRIARATLVLGPGGLNETNCLKKYKSITEALSVKYGPVRKKVLVKDPIIEDLLYSRECYAISRGVQEISSAWESKKFRISSAVYGDELDNEILIEIEYTNKFLKPVMDKSEKIKILRRL